MDAGNYAAVGVPGASIRNKGMIEGLNRIGYAAVMVGELELADGLEAFQEIAAGAQFPFVSANIVFEDDRSPIVKAYVVTTVKHGERQIRVAIFGLNRYNTGFLKSSRDGRNIIVASPFETARKLLPEMDEKADFIVLLTALSISQSRQLAKEVQGIDLIIGANGGVLSVDHDAAAGVPIVYTGNQGKHLSEIRVLVGAGEETAQITRRHHYLNRDYPVHPGLQTLVGRILTEENDLNRQLASAEVKRPAIAAGVATFVGGEACSSCHEDSHESWTVSAHARAFETLTAKNQDFNEECVACHSVGFGRAGGFINAKATPELKDVQCEACHGPGSLHAETPGHGYGTAGARSCLGCHDPENSPEFDFYAFWPRIKH